jgi:TonB family protein
MTASDSWLLLMETTLASSLAVLLVLVLRSPVRHAFGSGAAYGLWAIVPLTLLAVMLPAAIEPTLPVLGIAAPLLDGGASSPGMPKDARETLAWLPWAWGSGALAMLLALVWQQRRFLAGLGPLRRRPDGYHQSLATRGLPAVVGLWPRIVLPGDFEQRYSESERQLVLAHEREHLRRGDLPACVLAVALRSLFWFNPLVHLAARRFRQDQELACDTGVLRRFPDLRRTYASAMLKTQLADQPLPFGCHWSGSHPIKERLAMLTRPSPSLPRRLAGLLAVALLAVGAATFAWASQPGRPAEVPPGMLLLEVGFEVDGEKAHDMRAVVAPGVLHEERFEHAGQAWHTRWTVTPLADGTFDLSAVLERDGETVAEPRLIFRDDAAIKVGQETSDGGFKGLAVDFRVSSGPPAPGMAAIGIEGAVPPYPEQAAKAGEGGLVMLKVLVGTDGSARELQFVPEKSTVPEDSELVRSTLEVAAKWKFQPGVRDDEAVEGWVLVPVRFDPPAKAAGPDEAAGT